MAKVNNVGLNLTHTIANPFKTSRTSTTNPFKDSDFEGDISFKGSTLVSAEIFEGYVNKKENRLKKMITSSVAGSMTKLRSMIPESITNFVNRIKDRATGIWQDASNGVKNVSEYLKKDIIEVGKDISNSVSNQISSVGTHISNTAKDISGIGKNLSTKCLDKLNSLHHNKISKNTPVSELKNMWIEINNAAMKEVA